MTLPTEERIKLQAQPFDAKKQCWVPDAKESFVAAEITGTKGEEVTAKTAKGDVCYEWIDRMTPCSNVSISFHLVGHIEKG